MVSAALQLNTTLLPDPFAGCEPSVRALRARLGTVRLLVELRGHAAAHLRHLAAPLGFGARIDPVPVSNPVDQHTMGPDPPDGAPL